MVTDNSKGITGATGIVYNLLNLPQSIASANTTYTYDADGNKLRSVAGSVITDYVDGIAYNNGGIQYIETEEGRALYEGSSPYDYEYFLSDHKYKTYKNFFIEDLLDVFEPLENYKKSAKYFETKNLTVQEFYANIVSKLK